MRKRFLTSAILILCCIFNCFNVSASTKTYDRTNDNLRVPDYVTVTEANKSNILLTPAVDSTEKIYDFADLFTDKEEKILYDKVKTFIKESNLDLAIVTIKYNNKHSAQKYSDDFYDYNTFGTGDKHSGVLFLIDRDSGKIYMTTTGKAIDVYTDSRYSNILDNVYKYIDKQQYFTGTSRFIDLVLSYSRIDISRDGNLVINENGEVVQDNKAFFVAFIVAVVITLMVLLVMARMNKIEYEASDSKVYLKKDTATILKVKDLFLDSYVNKVKINNDHSRGRHIRGESVVQSGSGGSSHGEGGQRF